MHVKFIISGVIPSHVCKVLKSKKHRWDDIGRELGIDHIYQQMIKQDKSASEFDLLKQIIDEWIRSKCSPVKWSTIHDILLKKQWNYELQKLEQYLQKGTCSYFAVICICCI